MGCESAITFLNEIFSASFIKLINFLTFNQVLNCCDPVFEITACLNINVIILSNIIIILFFFASFCYIKNHHRSLIRMLPLINQLKLIKELNDNDALKNKVMMTNGEAENSVLQTVTKTFTTECNCTYRITILL